MAEMVYLKLKLNNVAILGESSQTSMGRQDSIECYSWAWGVEKPAGGSGRPVMGEIRFVQRIDKSTPLLFQGLVQNQQADGIFSFFRPALSGAGAEEHFFTVEGTYGRLTSISEWVPDTANPATSVLPPLLQVTMLFPTISNTYEINGGTFQWDSSAAP